MKINKLINFGLIAAFLFILMVGCNAEKEASERRNYMIPKKSEIARNSRYKEVEKRKTYKISKPKKKKKSLF